MKKYLSLFVKGIVLGIAFIIPGVSGGTLAVLLGIYEELLSIISNFYKSKKNFINAIKYLLPMGLGVVVSVGVCARIIGIGLEKAPIITLLIFLGLIIGGIPKLFKLLDKRVGIKEILFMLIGLVIVIGMTFIDKGSNVEFSNMNTSGYIILLLVGIVAAATMVIPGISGSFTLMLLGYYEPILNVVNELASFTDIKDNLLVFIPFLLGVGIGIILISKLINYLLKKWPKEVYASIIGFVISSIFSVFYQVSKYSFNLTHLIIGIILMIVNSVLVCKIFKD